MGKSFKIEVNRLDTENARIHEQCVEMSKLVDEGQIALIVLGEYTDEDGGIRCKASSVLHTDKKHGRLALAAALLDNMTKNDELRDIIFAAAALYEEREQQLTELN